MIREGKHKEKKEPVVKPSIHKATTLGKLLEEIAILETTARLVLYTPSVSPQNKYLNNKITRFRNVAR